MSPMKRSEIPIDSVPFLLILFDEEGRVQSWNEAARRALGLETAETSTPFSAELLSAVSTCVTTGQAARVEQAAVRVGGEERLFGFTAFPLRVENRVSGALVTGKDITDRARLRKELEEIEQSAQVEKVARRFAGALRDLLNAIRGNAQYLCSSPIRDSAAFEESAAEIVQAADRMDRILVNLEELGSAGDLRLRLADPEPCVRDAARLVLPLFEERAASLSVRIQTPLGNVLHDPDGLQRVIVSLLTNAAEAAGFGGCTELRAGPIPGAGLWVEVDDDGPGISPSLRGSLFDLFVSTKEGSARGLGLAIAQEIVHHHGGRISVSSDPGKGSTFRVEIPGA